MIVKLEAVRNSAKDDLQKNWSTILDLKNKYKLLYILHIIEYLMESNSQQEDKDFHFYLTNNNEELISLIDTWRSDFINFGGFDCLVEIFHTYELQELKDYSIFDKKILSMILDIFRNYLTACFSIENDEIYKQV